MAKGKPILITSAHSPCKGCADRSPECHGTCEAYAAFRAECAELARERHAKAEHEVYLADVIRRMPGRRII